MRLKIDQELEVNQTKVAGHLAHYFSTMADGIGGDNVQRHTEEDFNHHRSVRYIARNLPNATSEQFEFTPLSSKQVQETLEKLSPSKATGYDKINPRILKIGGRELAPSLP